ncbi:Uncharacterised protein [Prevotella pallens]|uniref:Uncharacterized protein n=1 Tax=Prevotella pallens TaxID=60133 RepID=A0A379GB36_9BACT|nr:Uncharacterised protein [Prevotella pallens]
MKKVNILIIFSLGWIVGLILSDLNFFFYDNKLIYSSYCILSAMHC